MAVLIVNPRLWEYRTLDKKNNAPKPSERWSVQALYTCILINIIKQISLKINGENFFPQPFKVSPCKSYHSWCKELVAGTFNKGNNRRNLGEEIIGSEKGVGEFGPLFILSEKNDDGLQVT